MVVGVMLMTAKKASRQATLFGDVVKADQDQQSQAVFIDLTKVVKKVGDKVSLLVSRAFYNEEKDCITLFSDNDVALTVWFGENAKYTTQTSGVRLGEALVKVAGSIDTKSEMSELFNDNDYTVHVEGVMTKAGHMARVWSVTE